MSTVTSGQSERTVAGWDRVSALLLHTERLLQLVENDDPATCDRSVDLELIRQLCGSVAEMREALVDREGQLARVTERSEALARAQADAIVHSAEIIDELERTKQSLSDARAAAEQAAQDTQRLADTVFEQTHDGVLVFHNHTCVACNDNSLDLLNSTRDDVIGRWPVSFTRAKLDTGASAETLLRQICTPGYAEEARSLEVRLQPVETHEFWAEVTATEFRMKDVGHVLLVVRDITARKKFEVELRRHRDFLNNIINAVPDPLSVKAVDRTLVVANDAFCNVLGVTRDEVLGQNADQLLPQHLASHIHSIEDRLLSTGDCSMAEHEIPRADGTTSIVSTKRSVFQDESSGERFIVATSRDITDDRLREDRLRLLASVFNSSTEGVAILSSEGTIREANPAFLSMSWNAEGTVLGRAISEALRFDDRELATALKQVEAGTSWSGKATATDKNRVTRSYWVSLSPSADLEEVSGRIIALVSDITELEATQAKLRRQAMYDNLTGLPNRRFFREHLQRLIEHSPSSSGVTICFLDLDDFKHVNDSAGHSTGDTLLQSVGRRIERVVGPDAFVARFGGDEFAIILTSEQQVLRPLAETLEGLLCAFRESFALGDTDAVVGLSIGVTHFPQHATDVDTLMCNADIAMYAAKAAGKNRIRIFTSDMQDGVNMRHQVQTKLRRALSEGEIGLCYQPKVDAETGQSAGCEALARWRTSSGEYIPPSDFIPVAEQTGLILPLGEVVFQLAAEQACRWFRQGIAPHIAVNVSPHQLRHPRYIEQLDDVLKQTGASADWFELEITEYAMMDDVVHAVSVIETLSARGFRVAIDDFGTGYSSLSYIKSFPIHTLKIDLSFVRDVTHDFQSNAIVRSIVSLGTGLGLTIVAEGVETAEQASVLTEAGVSILQGYYIGKPMSAQQYESWLEEQVGKTWPFVVQ